MKPATEGDPGLGDLRREALRLAATARLACREARVEVRAALAAGRHGDLARARALQARTEVESGSGLTQAQGILAAVDTELDRLRLAELERDRRHAENHRRLDAARAAAYGL